MRTILFTLLLFLINTAEAKDQCVEFFERYHYHSADQVADLRNQTVAFIPHLRRYARSLTQNNSKADDLVQDAIERAYQKFHLYAPDSNLRSWLFTIMRNIFISETRKPKTQSLTTENGADNKYLVPDQPADQYDHRLLEEVKALVAKLPPIYREAITLMGIEGKSYEEASEILKLPIGTVKSRLSRARVMLKALLDGTPIEEVLRQYDKQPRRVSVVALPAAPPAPAPTKVSKPESKPKPQAPQTSRVTNSVTTYSPHTELILDQARTQLSNLNVLGPAASSTSALVQYNVRWNNSPRFVLSIDELDFVRLLIAANGEEIPDNDLIAEIWLEGDTNLAQYVDNTQLDVLAHDIQAKFARAVPRFNKIQKTDNGWKWIN